MSIHNISLVEFMYLIKKNDSILNVFKKLLNYSTGAYWQLGTQKKHIPRHIDGEKTWNFTIEIRYMTM